MKRREHGCRDIRPISGLSLRITGLCYWCAMNPAGPVKPEVRAMLRKAEDKRAIAEAVEKYAKMGRRLPWEKV